MGSEPWSSTGASPKLNVNVMCGTYPIVDC